MINLKLNSAGFSRVAPPEVTKVLEVSQLIQNISRIRLLQCNISDESLASMCL